MRVLVTGAAGYIGSHTVLALLVEGLDVLAVDNHSNSSPAVYARLQRLAGRSFVHHTLDVRDEPALAACLAAHPVQACVHFAAHKAVGESMQQPLAYLHNNLGGLLSLLKVLAAQRVHTLVFSSSATVYGEPDAVPVPESAPLRPMSVYGHTKLLGEQVLHQLALSPEGWRTGVLRYFNPVGAHPSGEVGEAPQGVPNNLMPLLAQVAAGQRPLLQLYGHDYPTPDGTCVRDYIHIQDLAAGHVAALRHLLSGGASFTANLGTGQGTSVRELVDTFARVNGVAVPHTVAPRRPGDVACYYADPSLAHRLLGWRATRTLADMCRDAWRWQCQHPHGYA